VSVKSWRHYNPVRLVSGPINVLDQLVAGKNVLLVTTPGFVRRGTVDIIRQILQASKSIIWDGVKPNPDLRDLDAATEQFAKKNIDYVIGLGGGSAIDAAKVLSVTLANPQTATLKRVFSLGERPNWMVRLPLLVIPTTAGTGSEVTPFATIWDTVERKKHSMSGDFVYPDVALIDASLTLTLGKLDTLYPALDTLAHALESLWNINRTPVSEVFATQSLSLANEALPVILDDPTSVTARNRMQIASTLAGIAISQTRTAIAHSVSYPLTAHFGVPHGLAVGITLTELINIHQHAQPNGHTAQLIESSKDLLLSLDLRNEINKYVKSEQVIGLIGEMFEPSRAGNYMHKMNENIMKSILNKSLYIKE
jgi:alcohol dehydrogenase